MAGEALHAGSHLGEEKREHALGVRVRLPVKSVHPPANFAPPIEHAIEPAGLVV